MANRKLKDVREYCIKTVSDKKDPRARLTNQIVDLQLLKYAATKEGYTTRELVESIDKCIEGFIWLYENGGEYNKFPDIIKTNDGAKLYLDQVMAEWGSLQNYMQSHMHLMDV